MFACADTDANAKSWRSATGLWACRSPRKSLCQSSAMAPCLRSCTFDLRSTQRPLWERELEDLNSLARHGEAGSWSLTVTQCPHRNMAVSGCPPACAHLGNPDCGIFRGTLDGMRKIARREGFAALWRGTDVAFLMAIPTVSASIVIRLSPFIEVFMLSCSIY